MALSIVDANTGTSFQYTINGANRQPDEQKMQSHILKKINYPTGGYTSFIYEAHKFISKGVPSLGLGLRIGSTQVYDPVSGKTITNTYKYGENESGLGKLGTIYLGSNGTESALDESAFVTSKRYIADTYSTGGSCPQQGPGPISMRRRIISYFHPYAYFNFNLPVWYSEVNVYSDGGKTTYKYDYSPSRFFNYQKSDDDTKNYSIGWLQNLGLEGPKLKTKQVRDGNGKLLKETSIDYDPTVDGPAIKGIIVLPIAEYFTTSADYSSNPYCPHPVVPVHQGYDRLNCTSSGCSPQFVFNYYYPFEIHNYFIDRGRDNIASITQRDYQDDKVLETITSYTYDYNYQFNVASKSVTTSTNGSVTEYYYYPTSSSIPDISSLSSAQQTMVTTLLNNNRLTTPIQKNTFRNSTIPLTKQLFGYKDWGNGILAPEQIYAKTGSNNYESRLRFLSYDDKGNVLSVSKENDVKKTYLWGYNKTYPVAEITGVDYATASSYINQSILDNPTDEITLRNHLNNLRSIPNTLVSTYTYKPLVGATSVTDANTKTNYFFYDSYGRLVLTKDQNGKILKKYCYNYQGQQENCNLFTNAAINGPYYSQNCSGQSPEPYYVSVPADMFVSSVSQLDANAQAQQYGQNQANQYGQCSSDMAINYSNTSGSGGCTIQLYNRDTGLSYYFYANAYSSGTLGYVPQGSYDIHFSNDYYEFHYYSVCGNNNSGYTFTSIYDVYFGSGCSSIDIY